ncbi:hypothetical protein CBR_g21159 [Chara braunii]|uniref:Reverse transcriptase domain-containing protein n=1 Tax=Chara braunii TaxID=69332 RepID=A0A388L0U1_CHABU|nr:hypothetical protein CBR_g21159 [Chara braunii]|eukprot:GBG75917.1 hypothetical protein CBR_g21159 [Chara braunii]
METEQRRRRLEQERREAELRRMNEEIQSEMRTIAAVARELQSFRAEVKNEIKLPLSVRSKTPKEKSKGKSRAVDEDCLREYLTGEAETSRDAEERALWTFTRRNRGRRVARGLHSPSDTEEGGRITQDSEPRMSKDSVEKKVPAANGREGMVEYVLNIQKRLSEKTAQELKRLCEAEGIEYVNKEQAVKELVRIRTKMAYEGCFEDQEAKPHDGSLSTTSKKKGCRKGKRERLAAARREGKQRSGGDQKNGLITFTRQDYLEKTTSLRRILKEAHTEARREIKISSHGGSIWGEDWAVTKQVFGSSVLHFNGKKLPFAQAKSILQEEGSFWITQIKRSENAQERRKGYLQLLLRLPWKRKELWGFEVDKLMHLYAGAGAFHSKSTRKQLKDAIGKVVSGKVGINIRRRIVIALQYDSTIKKREVRVLVAEEVEKTDLHRSIKSILKRKMMVVWRKNETVASLLCNHYTVARSAEGKCTCSDFQLPRSEGHVLTRISELTDIRPELTNSRNIARPTWKLRENQLQSTIFQAVKGVLKGKMKTTEQSLSVQDCLQTRREDKPGVIEEAEVKQLKREFDGLVVVPVDRNSGDLALMCPATYHWGLEKMFIFNTAYTPVMRTGASTTKKAREEYKQAGLKRIAAWNGKRRRGKTVVLNRKSIGAGYVQIKFERIREYVRYELEHTFTTCGGKLLRQAVGIPMGKNTSPALACVMCARYETAFMAAPGKDRKLVYGTRFMDDAAMAVLVDRSDEASFRRAEEIFEDFGRCYGAGDTRGLRKMLWCEVAVGTNG